MSLRLIFTITVLGSAAKTATADDSVYDNYGGGNWVQFVDPIICNGGQLKAKHNKNGYCIDTTKALNALYPYIRGVTNGFIFTCEYDQIYANDNREGCITFTNDLDKALVDVDSEYVNKYRCDDSRGARYNTILESDNCEGLANALNALLKPTSAPTAAPTSAPTSAPTPEPTPEPTPKPTLEITAEQSTLPPTATPTAAPTTAPTPVGNGNGSGDNGLDTDPIVPTIASKVPAIAGGVAGGFVFLILLFLLVLSYRKSAGEGGEAESLANTHSVDAVKQNPAFSTEGL